MSASQILLAGHGPEDRWLTDNPNRTYFEATYQPRVNRSRETYEIPFDSQGTTFGTTGVCTIPVKGDYLTRITLRAVLPPIYPTVQGQYVFPTPSSQVDGAVYVNMGLTQVVADGTTLTANTTGSHYFSIGATVTLSGTAYSIFDLDGTYTISTISTANSFTCSTTLAGISYSGTASVLGFIPSDVVGYFSTSNFDLWGYNLTNKIWSITNVDIVGTQLTITTSTPSGFSTGQRVHILISSFGIDDLYTVLYATDKTLTIDINKYLQTFVSIGNYDLSVLYRSMYSTDNGQSWLTPLVTPSEYWQGVAYGNGTFVAVGYNSSMYSTDNGKTWSTPIVTPSGVWQGVSYGNGTFVAVGYNASMYSTDYGQSWLTPLVTPSGNWQGVSYGNGTFVAVGPDISMYSIDNGQTWLTPLIGTPFGNWRGVAYGNGTFVAVGLNVSMYSTDYGQSWLTPLVTPSGNWRGVSYGNGTFVAVGYNSPGPYITNGITIYSSDGQIWINTVVPDGQWESVTSGESVYTQNISDILYLETPPLNVLYSTNFNFSSSIYPSISFANSRDAAFWGFDSRNGFTYSFPISTPWTLTQGGWVSGFLPPSLSTWDDSVAHKLCKEVRILVGKQTIKEYTGEYIELQNDLLVPYENKAILKLMIGTLDQTQAITTREYYTTLPLGTKEFPLCALTQQQMSVEVDFELFTNLSQNLNQGTGDFLDAKSYTTYDASTGILGGQPVNVQTTFSYQQYIFVVTYDGIFIVYDTTKNVDDSASYIVISAFSGSSLFKQFCVISGNLYIGLTNGQLARMFITELIQGNISSFTINNYEPTIGSLTGTIVTDFRYVYYTVSNTATSNVFFSKYDTTGSFTSPGSYTTFNFTSNIDSTTTSNYQLISTGSKLIAITNTPGKFYTFNLNGNFTTSWNSVDYSTFAYQITSGVLIGTTLYFLGDSYNLIKYTNDDTFRLYQTTVTFVAAGFTDSLYSFDNGQIWSTPFVESGETWNDIAYGNGTFVAVGYSASMYSTDNGQSWLTPLSGTPSGSWFSVTYGNGTFVAVGYNDSMYSTDNGQSWLTPLSVTPSGSWRGVAYGNGTFVAVDYNGQSMYSTDNGKSWSTPIVTPIGYLRSVTYGNGTFVAVGYNDSMYSIDNGQSWLTPLSGTPSGSWFGVAYGNGTFVAVDYNGQSMYSTDNGKSWSTPIVTPIALLYDITYGNGTFVAVGYSASMYSIDNGQTWLTGNVTPSGYWYCIASSNTAILPISGSGITNLLAVGSTIYASSNAAVIQIDTTQDLTSPLAYKYYSSTTPNAPAVFDGTAPKIFANGPRYVYMFTQGDNTAANIVRYDPYPPDTTFKASIIVDYESLPPGVPKPDKALIGVVQTQKVTDMTQMNIKGPVKELWVTGASDTANVFQYSNLAARSMLELTGEHIVTEDVGTRTFLNVIEPFETHTSMPIRNFSVIPFEFDPESDIPNGTINFSRIRDQVFDGNAETVWAHTYNLLAIQGGVGGLMFN